jgi:hypothetical protein
MIAVVPWDGEEIHSPHLAGEPETGDENMGDERLH